MGKVNVRAGMKREREGCVLSKGKPVPRDGLHLRVLLSPSFSVLLWVHLLDSLPVK